MTHEAARPPSRLLDGLPAPDRDRAEAILADAPTIELLGGVPYFGSSFAAGVLLVVEEGSVVVRAVFPPPERSVITSHGGPGAVLVAPRSDEVLAGLARSQVTAISAETRDRLLALPVIARRLVERLTAAMEQREESIKDFAPARHVERVRRKLLHLARRYGRVVREGTRIDFPISHALLAEMIGSSRETVTRALDELERDGFVLRAGSTYWLQ